jgi:transcriptional regulator with AAA-type ATPase domain/tetratricopeptide (TPR) repeat protein
VTLPETTAMRDRDPTIDELIGRCEGYRRRGEYDRGYDCSRRLIEIASSGGVEEQMRCRALVEAARHAYYASRFEESVTLLERVRGLLPSLDPEIAHRFELEAALIGANVSRRLGRYDEACELLESFESRWPEELRAERLLIEGACRYYTNDFRTAREKLEASLGLAALLSDDRIRSRVLVMRGLLDQRLGLLRSAEEYLRRARELCLEETDHYGEAAAALDLGIVQYRQGRFAEARESIERARSVFQQVGWAIGVCRAVLAHGNVEKYARELGKAVRHYRKAARIASAHGFVREQALAEEYIGEVCTERGEYEIAAEHFERGLELAARVGAESDITVEILRRLGELCVARRDLERSLAVLEEGLELSRRIKERLEEGAILRTMGTAHAAAGERGLSEECYREALEVLRQVGARFEIAKTHLYSVESLATEGVNGSLRPRQDLSMDDIQRIWRDLVEADHLFAEAGISYWKERSGRLLESFSRLRRAGAGRDWSSDVAGSVVSLRHNDDCLVSEHFVCVSEPMQRVWDRIGFAASSERPVLITGETGTGKEVVARLIHQLSRRASRPFVAVNCAAIPDHLFESEFFGHRRGCFTGAVADRAGIFEEVNGGTLFLDEIGELTTLQQVKLLRVLQEKAIRRIGENVERPVDIRVLSATNRDIERRVEGASFREDFYYRINAEQIHLPPLRQRPEDIVPLITYFLCGRNGAEKRFVLIEEAALKCLQGYRWPGNVRELFMILERAKDMGNGGPIGLGMLPERLLSGRARLLSTEADPSSAGDRDGRIRKALSLCNGNKSAAARWLGISRGTLYKELRRMGLGDTIRERSFPQ